LFFKENDALVPLFCTDFLEERTLTGVGFLTVLCFFVISPVGLFLRPDLGKTVVDNVKPVRGGKRKRSLSASDVEPTMKPQTPVKSPAAKRTRGKAPVKIALQECLPF
jgi:hypothetical protein